MLARMIERILLNETVFGSRSPLGGIHIYEVFSVFFFALLELPIGFRLFLDMK